MPYFTSAPKVMFCWRAYPLAVGRGPSLETEYGSTSRRRGLAMPSKPSTSPNCETKPICVRR